MHDPQDEPSERDILLEIAALLEKQVKQTDEIQRESHEYRNQERQYLFSLVAQFPQVIQKI